MIFTESRNPLVVANRVLKRLVRDDYIIQIPQPRDKPYLYMPNPTIIPPSSGRLLHFLGIADVYISLEQPPVFVVEPDMSKEYRPDAYVRLKNGATAVVEYQRSRISTPKMQEKVDQFVKYGKVKTMLVYTHQPYELNVPTGFQIVQKKIVNP